MWQFHQNKLGPITTGVWASVVLKLKFSALNDLLMFDKIVETSQEDENVLEILRYSGYWWYFYPENIT